MANFYRKRWHNGRYNRLFDGKGIGSLNFRMDARFEETLEKLLATGKWTNQAELIYDLIYRFSRVEHPEWELPVLPLTMTEQEKQFEQMEDMINALSLNV